MQVKFEMKYSHIICALCILLWSCGNASETSLERAITKVLLSSFGSASTSRQWPFVPALRKDRSSSNTSTVETLCANLLNSIDRRRLACCPQHNGATLYLKNVKIEKGKMILYVGSKGSSTALKGPSLPDRLPPITSIVRRKHVNYFMPVEQRQQDFATAQCKSYFNGTLHVMGRLTTQNLYHAFNDNVLPLLTLVVMDAILQRDMLLAPRAQLIGFHPPADPEQVPHLAALLDAALPQSFTVGGSAEGVCFRRVAWGGGIKVVYQHLLGAVRRLSSDLLRELVLQAFSPPSPYEHVPYNVPSLKSKDMDKGKRVVAKSKMHNMVPSSESLTMPTSTGERRPMNIVIYSRGNAGGGRSIGNETLLQDRLRSLGARAVICCDFAGGVTLIQQFGYGVHADAIVGLHGAGLINNIYAPRGVITVELKTIYGYGLTLFATSAEARGGPFIELNIKDYHIWGAPGQSRSKPMDEPLIGRVVASLQQVIQNREESAQVGKSTESAATLLSTLIEMNFRKDLFHHLKIPDGRNGDIVIYPYPTDALFDAHYRSRLDTQKALTSPYQQLSEVERSQLDFLLHLLGPEVSETRAQCAKLPVSAYWAHTGEKNVHNKYCLSCSFLHEDQLEITNKTVHSHTKGAEKSSAVRSKRTTGAVLSKLQH